MSTTSTRTPTSCRRRSGSSRGDYNPHYFVNPPAFSYLLHARLRRLVRRGLARSAPARRGIRCVRHRPGGVFLVARVTDGVARRRSGRARLRDRRPARRQARRAGRGGRFRCRLPARLLLAPRAQRRAGAACRSRSRSYGSAGVLVRGRRRDYLIAGAGLGLAAATKYTAGIVAAAACWRGDFALRRGRGRRAARVRGVALAGAVALRGVRGRQPARAALVLRVLGRRRKQESAAGDLGKLGQNNDSGIALLPLGPDLGVGWAPAIAAAVGARSLSRFRPRTRFLPRSMAAVFILFMGLQDRYFGRWLLPALPAIALLAAFAAVTVRRPISSLGARRTAVLVIGAGRRARRVRASSTASTSTACSRATTRATSRTTGWSATFRRARRSSSSRSFRAPGPTSRPNLELAGQSAAAAGASSSSRARPSTSRDGKRRGNVGRTISIEDYERTTQARADRRVRARRLLLGDDRLDPVRTRARASPMRCRGRSATTERSPGTAISSSGPIHTSMARARWTSTSIGVSTTTRWLTSGPVRRS